METNLKWKPYFSTRKGHWHRTEPFTEEGEVVQEIEWEYLIKAVCGTSSYSGGLSETKPDLRSMCMKCFLIISEEYLLRDRILEMLNER